MIYYFDNYNNDAYEKFLPTLPDYRREQLDKLKIVRDKENCLFSFIILQQALKNEFGITNFKIESSANGKPFIVCEKKIHFNISHCNCGIAVALGTAEIGIDIQPISVYNPKVVKRVFSENEQNYIENKENRDEEFIRIWTLKEAAVKCSGEGLTGLSKYSFDNCENSFQKYGKNFISFRENSVFISVCSKQIYEDINFVDLCEQCTAF